MDMYQKKIKEFVKFCGSYTAAAYLATKSSGITITQQHIKQLCEGENVEKDIKNAVLNEIQNQKNATSIDPT